MYRNDALVIREGEVLTCPPDQELPFNSSVTAKIGFGGYGTVYKEVIAIRHFQYKPEVPSALLNLNEAPITVARKRYPYAPDFEREYQFLQCLNDSPGRHRGVIQELAGLRYENKFNLLLPLAESNLEMLQVHTDISTHSIRDLLSQLADVADALSWLHTGVRTSDDKVVKACHMDLNPSNILVFQSGAPTPVCVWKITDFSTSTLTLDNGQELLPPPKLVPLTYSAPEIQEPIARNRASPECDVWSLGCILFELLIGFVDGREKAVKWRDKWNNMPRFLDESSEGPVLSSRVQKWLNGKHTDTVVISCKQLILDLLKLVPMERLTAAKLRESLTSVVRKSYKESQAGSV